MHDLVLNLENVLNLCSIRKCGRAVHYLRYSYMSASREMRPKYDSRFRKERVRFIVAISDLSGKSDRSFSLVLVTKTKGK